MNKKRKIRIITILTIIIIIILLLLKCCSKKKDGGNVDNSSNNSNTPSSEVIKEEKDKENKEDANGVGIGISGNDYGDSDVVINNCAITHEAPDQGLVNFLKCAVAPQYDGKVTINGGTYESNEYAVYIYTTGGTAIINSGTFTADKVLKSQYSTNLSYRTVNDKSEIIINGGTFNGTIDSCNGTNEKITINNNAIVNGSIGSGVIDNRVE